MDLKRAIELLELSGEVDPIEIKRAFARQAHQWHPDKNPSEEAAAEFRSRIQAYEFCLSNLDLLARHFGKPAPKVSPQATPITDFDDILEGIFGFTGKERVLGYQEPQVLVLNLTEFYSGSTKNLKLKNYEKCPDCSGVGAARGTRARLCRYCFGQGAVSDKPCSVCSGRGREISEPCSRCAGFGRLERNSNQRLTIPMGWRPGELYTVETRDLKGGQTHQACLRPVLSQNESFRVEKYDLVCELACDFRVGARKPLTVNIPSGRVFVPIAPNAKPGDIVTISGYGLALDSSGRRRGALKVVLRARPPGWWQELKTACLRMISPKE